jgi:Na+-transporting NADH:ubiquinone oxidoreductase subunit NqrF
MARAAASERLPHRLYLFYANRRPEDAAFLSELQAMEQANRNFRLITVMAEPEKSQQRWTGETGYIRRELLERHLPDVKSPVYYLAGPPAMSMAMQRMLADMGIAESSLRHEEFYGY